MRLEVGVTYECDGWLFVVLREDEHEVTAMLLNDASWRHKAGDLIPIFRNSAVGQAARAVE